MKKKVLVYLIPVVAVLVLVYAVAVIISSLPDETTLPAEAAATALPEETESSADPLPSPEVVSSSDAVLSPDASASPDTETEATDAPTEKPTARPLAEAQGVKTLISGETFGTQEKLTEAQSKYVHDERDELKELAKQTGLDEDVLARMYSPFYALDLDPDEDYYLLKSPGGKKSEFRIFGRSGSFVEIGDMDDEYTYVTVYRYPGGRKASGYVKTSLIKKVEPKGPYAIIIDKREQKLFLFKNGELKEEMYCSTGKTTTETPAGEFVKSGTKRTIYSDADPDVAYYGVHLNGRVYIHSVSEVHGDYSKSISMLGRKSSHGCIRIPLDWAKWMYENLPDGTKVTITEYRGDTPPLGEGGRDGD